MSSVTGKKTAIAPAGQPQIKTERYVARTELHSLLESIFLLFLLHSLIQYQCILRWRKFTYLV